MVDVPTSIIRMVVYCIALIVPGMHNRLHFHMRVTIIFCRKLSWVLTNRILKFLQDRAKKQPAEYKAFYNDYGMFLREGIVSTPEQQTRVSMSGHMISDQSY